MTPAKRIPTHKLLKVQYLSADGRMRVLWGENMGSKDGVIVGKFPNDKTFFLPETSPPNGVAFYFTKRQWIKFWHPPEFKTWKVHEGYPGAVIIREHGDNGDKRWIGEAAKLSDKQLNTLLHTKVIEEVLMADLFASVWNKIQLFLIIAILLGFVAAAAGGYAAYQEMQNGKAIAAIAAQLAAAHPPGG